MRWQRRKRGSGVGLFFRCQRGVLTGEWIEAHVLSRPYKHSATAAAASDITPVPSPLHATVYPEEPR